MKRKALWILLGIFLIAIIAVYQYLGGFHEVKMEVVEVNHYHLIGSYYEGKYERDSIATLYFNAKELLGHKEVSGVLSIINYLAEENNESVDSIKTFVGIILEKEPNDFPPQFEYRKIDGGKILRASIDAHSLVMPARKTIEDKMKKFAQKNNLLLKPLTIEKYVSDEKIIIEGIISR